MARKLNDNAVWRARVEGYTDNVGSKTASMTLSTQRATAVMNWLIDHGVDHRRLTAKGYGDARPSGENQQS